MGKLPAKQRARERSASRSMNFSQRVIELIAILPLTMGVAASIATLLGGIITLRMRRYRGMITALSAGVVVGVALFDLFPEARSMVLPSNDRTLFMIAILGFAAYFFASRLLHASSNYAARLGRHIGPAALTLHSIIDGLGIGLGFRLSSSLGLSVALAVLSHDIADGVNIVALSGRHGTDRSARLWLTLNVVAPVLGVAIAQLIHLDSRQFAPMLAALSGIFIYIGAAELFPRSELRKRGRAAVVAAATGLSIIFFIAQLHG